MEKVAAAQSDTWSETIRKIKDAIDGVEAGNMDPWFGKGKTSKEWFSRLDPKACREMIEPLLDNMVRLKLEGKSNSSFRMNELLVRTVERSRDAQTERGQEKRI